MKIHHMGLALLVMIIWGLNFPVAKFGLQEMPPLLLLAFRFAAVALLLVPFVPIPKAKMGQIFMLSVVLGTIHFALMFVGISGVDASVASIAIQLQVPFAAIMAAIVFKDRFGWRRMLGMGLAFGGIVLIAGEPRMQTSLLYLGLVVAASFVWAVSNIQVKLIGAINPLSLTGWTALFAFPQLLVWSWILESGQRAAIVDSSWVPWAVIAYMAILVSVVGYGIWYYLVPRYQVNQTMPFTLTVPVFGVFFGVWLLGESVTLPMLLGGALTILGVGIIVLRRPRTADGPLQN